MNCGLGAIELIELGRGGAFNLAHRPFLANRPGLGQFEFLADAGSFITGTLKGVFDTMGSLVSAVTGPISGGLGFVLSGAAGIAIDIPIIGSLLSQAFLMIKAVIDFSLALPAEILRGIGSIFGALKALFDGKKPEEKKTDLEKAKDILVGKAPGAVSKDVSAMLSLAMGRLLGGADGGDGGIAPPGVVPPRIVTTPVPSGPSSLEKALLYGVPVAAGTVALVLLLK